MRLRGLLAFVLVGALGITVACTKDPPGEVVLSFQTDMAVPKDVSSIVLTITSTGRTLFEEQYAVGPTGVKLPSTFGVVEGEKDEPITIRLIALKGTKPIVLRETVTKIPKGRVVGMKMPIEWLCLGESSVKGEIRQGAENQCPAGQTCSAGTCVPSDSFPVDDPYDAKAVFGGGDDKGQGGGCFSTESCFASVQTVAVTPADDGTTCGFTLDNVKNVALEPEDRVTGIGTGPNGGAPFLIPLDQGKTGFELQGNRVTLPRAVCARVPRGLRVYATRSCSPKTNRQPTCGPWSAVATPAGQVDGGAVGEAGNPAWKAVPLAGPAPFLRIAGVPSGRRAYVTVVEAGRAKVLSCDVGSCTAESLRCEATFSGPPLALTVQQKSPNDPPSAIYAVVGASTLEVADTLGACAIAKPVTLPGGPSALLDIAATPTELLLLADTRLGACTMSTPTNCSELRTLKTFAAPASQGRLDVNSSVAYIHGTRVGGCTDSQCAMDKSTERDVSQAPDSAGPPLDIVTLPGNYFWIDQRGPVMTVRDCPNTGTCGGIDLTTPGVFGALGVNDKYIYLGGIDGLYRATRPTGSPGPQGSTPNLVEAQGPVGDVLVEGTTVYYVTEKGLFRFTENGQ